MKRMLWQFCLLGFGLVLLALALPGAVAAAPDYSNSLVRLSDTLVVEGPVQATFQVPGIFSVKVDQNTGDAEIDVPSLNSVATVSKLQIGQNNVAWDLIGLKQKQPIRTQSFALSDAQASVSGAAKGYTTEASATVELYPSRAFAAKGKVYFKYDGVRKTGGFAVQNASVNMPTWPVGVVAANINSSSEAFSVDSAQVSVPGADTVVTIEGYQLKNGRSDWKTFTVAQGKSTVLKLGGVATISGMQATLAGSSGGGAANVGADFKVDVSNTVRAGGKLVVINGPQATGVGLANGSMALGSSGWSLNVTGMNSVKNGVKIDNVTIGAKPLYLEAILKGVTVGSTAGFTFDQALVKYTPDKGGAFQVEVTKSPEGYILTTTSLIPVAASK